MNKIIIFLIILLGVSCTDSKKHMIGRDLRLWRGTQGWSLAKAVRDEDSIRIREILAESKISVDFRDPKFGQTLLSWAVLNNRVKAVRLLLEMGANPNLHNNCKGESPVLEASEIGVDIEILQMILDHGGNPNERILETEKLSETPSYETPLIRSAMTSLPKTKLLVKYGADVNMILDHKGLVDETIRGRETPLMSAVLWERVDIVSYLMFEKGADFKETYGITIDRDTISFAEMLRDWDFPLESNEYKEKMKIVRYVKEHGQDYWKMPIPKDIVKNHSKEYLEKY